MKKIKFFIVLGLFLVINAYSSDFTGEGSKKNPYLIQSERDLLVFSGRVSQGDTFAGKYFLQTKNITMTTDNFKPIGIFNTDKFFSGTYDGDGHSISNLVVKYPNENVALFAYLGGTIMNLGVVNSTVEGACCGVIASHAQNGKAKIINCYSIGNTVTAWRSGGIADNFNGTIINCYTCECHFNGDSVGAICSYDCSNLLLSYANTLYDKDINLGVQLIDDKNQLINVLNQNLNKVAIKTERASMFNEWQLDEKGALILTQHKKHQLFISIFLFVFINFPVILGAVFLGLSLFLVGRPQKKQP